MDRIILDHDINGTRLRTFLFDASQIGSASICFCVSLEKKCVAHLRPMFSFILLLWDYFFASHISSSQEPVMEVAVHS